MQLVLRCTLSSGSREWEVTIDRAGTVAECCELMVHSAGLEGRLILKVKVKKSMRPSLSVMAHMLCHNMNVVP